MMAGVRTGVGGTQPCTPMEAEVYGTCLCPSYSTPVDALSQFFYRHSYPPGFVFNLSILKGA